MSVHEASEIEHAIDDFAHTSDGGLLVLPDATTNLHRALIIALTGDIGSPQFMHSAISQRKADSCPMA